MELIGAFAAALAMGSLILALAPRKADPGPRLEASVRGVVARRLERSRDELAKARLTPGASRVHIYDQPLRVLACLLVGGFVLTLLVRPLKNQS